MSRYSTLGYIAQRPQGSLLYQTAPRLNSEHFKQNCVLVPASRALVTLSCTAEQVQCLPLTSVSFGWGLFD